MHLQCATPAAVAATKSATLASYAKQSGDKTLEHAAMRIRAGAVRRCGELLGGVLLTFQTRTSLQRFFLNSFCDFGIRW
jgi:hypothetical protein